MLVDRLGVNVSFHFPRINTKEFNCCPVWQLYAYLFTFTFTPMDPQNRFQHGDN